MQKHKYALAGAMILGLGLTGAAVAQDQAAPPMQGRKGGMAMDPDRQVQMLAKQLNLTTDQSNQIRPILQDQQKQMMDLRNDTSTSREDKMAKMQSIRQDGDAKIKAVLNDDQKVKYDQWQQERRQRMMERRQQQAPPDGSNQ